MRHWNLCPIRSLYLATERANQVGCPICTSKITNSRTPFPRQLLLPAHAQSLPSEDLWIESPSDHNWLRNMSEWNSLCSDGRAMSVKASKDVGCRYIGGKENTPIKIWNYIRRACKKNHVTFTWGGRNSVEKQDISPMPSVLRYKQDTEVNNIGSQSKMGTGSSHKILEPNPILGACVQNIHPQNWRQCKLTGSMTAFLQNWDP